MVYFFDYKEKFQVSVYEIFYNSAFHRCSSNYVFSHINIICYIFLFIGFLGLCICMYAIQSCLHVCKIFTQTLIFNN